MRRVVTFGVMLAASLGTACGPDNCKLEDLVYDRLGSGTFVDCTHYMQAPTLPFLIPDYGVGACKM